MNPEKATYLPPERQEIFRRYLLGASIETIRSADLPEQTVGTFEWAARRLTDARDQSTAKFTPIYYLVTHANGDRTYVVRQLKWRTMGKGSPHQYLHVEYNTQFVDVDAEGKIQGRSELVLAFPKERFYKNKPYEEYSETEEPFRRRGLSLRRTMALNAFSQMMWGLPLYSSTLFVHGHDELGNEVQPQKLVWEKLVRMGLARKFRYLGQDRFVFKSDLDIIGQ